MRFIVTVIIVAAIVVGAFYFFGFHLSDLLQKNGVHVESMRRGGGGGLNLNSLLTDVAGGVISGIIVAGLMSRRSR